MMIANSKGKGVVQSLLGIGTVEVEEEGKSTARIRSSSKMKADAYCLIPPTISYHYQYQTLDF